LIENDKVAIPEAAAEQDLLAKQVQSLLTGLNPWERDVLRLRYGLNDGMPRTLEQTGKSLSLGRERVRQIELKALKKLGRASRIDELRAHLN
jgi:RNA polymerase nonessential primary-like sigma factor